MNPVHEGEDKVADNPVIYMRTPAERSSSKINIVDGRPVTVDGTPLDTQGSFRANFILSLSGDLYVMYESFGNTKHSSFMAGRPVAFAGEIVVSNGKIIQITDRSGHYLPRGKHTRHMLKHLKKMGVSLDDVYISTDRRAGYSEPAVDFLKRGNFPKEFRN